MRAKSPSFTIHINRIRKITPLKKDEAAIAAMEVLTHEWAGDGEVSITFDGDERLQKLNREYLGKDEPTDVIAFELKSGGGFLLGDVYVSVDRAVEQAREHDVRLGEELLRLELHGILHLVGYDHDGSEGTMWKRQEYWLKKLSKKVGPWH